MNVSPSVDWKGEKLRMISVEPLVTNTLDEAFVLDMVTEPLFQAPAAELQERTSGSPTYCCLVAADAHAKPIMVAVCNAPIKGNSFGIHTQSVPSLFSMMALCAALFLLFVAQGKSFTRCSGSLPANSYLHQRS